MNLYDFQKKPAMTTGTWFINWLEFIDERIKLIKFMRMILISVCTNNL